MDSELLRKMNEDMVLQMRLHMDVHSVLVIRKGYIVAEQYYSDEYQVDSLHRIYSCTKSITSALIGIAIDKGYIKSIDQPVIEFFPDKSFNNLDDNKRAMTVKHLLMMAPGIKCRDSYKYQWDGLKVKIGVTS